MAFSTSSTFGHERAPGAGVTAVLGPTNTGKTHLAIERMLAHSSGVIGLPLLLGAATMRPIIERLLPGASIVTRPRLSQLEFAGDRKIRRQPRRTAIVAFSADEVYAIAELIKRQHGGAAVVLGSLSPRTRNAQVAMFQSGDVDYLVATD